MNKNDLVINFHSRTDRLDGQPGSQTMIGLEPIHGLIRTDGGYEELAVGLVDLMREHFPAQTRFERTEFEVTGDVLKATMFLNVDNVEHLVVASARGL